MKNIIILFFYFSIIYADNTIDIGFRYGFLSKPSEKSNDITVLSDSSIIHTGDWLKINIGYKSKTNFCIVYKDAVGDYSEFKDERKEANQDTVYAYPLYWAEMKKPPGIETFYFINSTESLSELKRLLDRYDNAPQKGKSKLAVLIKEKIDSLDPNVQDDLSSISSRLDKPVTGGVAFRGENDDKIKELHLTHEYSGSGGMAFLKIVLIHQP